LGHFQVAEPLDSRFPAPRGDPESPCHRRALQNGGAFSGRREKGGAFHSIMLPREFTPLGGSDRTPPESERRYGVGGGTSWSEQRLSALFISVPVLHSKTLLRHNTNKGTLSCSLEERSIVSRCATSTLRSTCSDLRRACDRWSMALITPLCRAEICPVIIET